MGTRAELQVILQTLLGSDHVYFQPPESMKLQYPCFVYERNPGYTARADNKLYRYKEHYQLTYITDDADTQMPVTVLRLFEHCGYERVFVFENLYHHVFNLYY